MNTEKHRPTSLRIMGREFEVDYEDELDGGRSLGLCYATDGVIEIANGQHPIEEADTILHETLHVLCYLMNLELKSREEKVVRLLSTGLIQVFLDNPNFLKYLTKVVNSNNRGA